MMFRALLLSALALPARSIAFKAVESNSKRTISMLDLNAASIQGALAPETAAEKFSHTMPLKIPMMDLPGDLPARSALEGARYKVWDHVTMEPSASMPCCPEFPYCPCPKL